MAIRKLTARQEEIYKLITQKIREQGSPPTRAEIAEHMGFKSANAAEDHLRALARKGLLKLIPGTSRGIRLVEDLQGLPLIQLKNAKGPLLEHNEVTKHVTIDESMFIPKPHYLLCAKDNSMSAQGILEGDYLCVHQTTEAYTGQTVVVLHHGHVLIRKLKRNLEQITLEAGDPHVAPIHLTQQELRHCLEGVCVGVIRNHI